MGKLYDFSINPKKRDISLFEATCKKCNISTKQQFIKVIMKLDVEFEFLKIFIDNLPVESKYGEKLHNECLEQAVPRNLEYILTLDSFHPDVDLSSFSLKGEFGAINYPRIREEYNILFRSNKFICTPEIYKVLFVINHPDLIADYLKSNKFVQLNTEQLTDIIRNFMYEKASLQELLSDSRINVSGLDKTLIKILEQDSELGPVIKNRMKAIIPS